MTLREPSFVPEPDVLEHLVATLERARWAIAHRRDVLHQARTLLHALHDPQLRVELAHAAAAFAEGTDERHDAERWVTFAIGARALLEEARKNGGASLAREIDALDVDFEDVREAVLLLEPEDYREALAATPPNTGRWWGERARLDEGIREIEIERALGDLRERSSTSARIVSLPCSAPRQRPHRPRS
jgi:hypothetical protein